MFWNWLHQETGLQLWQVIGITVSCACGALIIGLIWGKAIERKDRNKEKRERERFNRMAGEPLEPRQHIRQR